jgi:hypothetical protein
MGFNSGLKGLIYIVNEEAMLNPEITKWTRMGS